MVVVMGKLYKKNIVKNSKKKVAVAAIIVMVLEGEKGKKLWLGVLHFGSVYSPSKV